MASETDAIPQPLETAVAMAQLQRENERLLRRTQQIEEQVRALLVLQGVANTISAELDLPPLLRRIALAAVRLSDADVAALYLVQPAQAALTVEAIETAQTAADSGAFSTLDVIEISQPRARREDSPRAGRPGMPLGAGVAGWVALSGELVLVADPLNDHRFPLSEIEHDNQAMGIRARSLLAVPMIFKTTVIGVLVVAQTERSDGFDARSLDFMRTLAAQVAVAVTNAELYQRLRGERDRVIQTQEDERKRLGRELHDGPAQRLAQIAMSLEYAERLTIEEPQSVAAELRTIRETVLSTTREIRNLLFDLRPLVLDAEHGGLVAALTHFLARFEQGHGQQHGPQMHLDAHYDQRLSHNAELTAFAIVQEAVNNVLKHANAKNCWIEVREAPDKVLAMIRDDGDGFNVREVREEYEGRGSWGVLSMLERAALIDARLQIASQPGRGTVVSLEVPR